MVLLHLSGEREQWRAADNIIAHYRWVADRNEMKRNLYVFLKEGLGEFLQKNGMSE
jgi:hypothetical protein